MRVDLAIDELRRRGFSVSLSYGAENEPKIRVRGGQGSAPAECMEAIRADKAGAVRYLQNVENREGLALDFANLFSPSARHQEAGARGILRRLRGDD
jgi:hypothetical protein